MKKFENEKEMKMEMKNLSNEIIRKYKQMKFVTNENEKLDLADEIEDLILTKERIRNILHM